MTDASQKKAIELAKNTICKFLKDAFCVSGEVRAVEISTANIEGETWNKGRFELNDTNRGKFYVTIENKNHDNKL